MPTDAAMRRGRRAATAALALVCACTAERPVGAVERTGATGTAVQRPATGAPEPSAGAFPYRRGAGASVPVAGSIRFVAAASGAFPADTQVSLEQDVALAARTLAGPGVVLLAAGPDAPVLARTAPPTEDTVRDRLRDLFAPAAPSGLTFAAPSIPVDGPADRDTLLAVLSQAARQTDAGPLFVYLGGHGERGQTPADNRIVTWGGDGASAGDLADALAGARRPVVLVSSACFSGGLAEVAFARTGTDGPAVCGLFAAPWDREASGCDPDPRRRRQEGFALHFFPALAGRTADGGPIPRDRIDFDGDGRISPLEAHAHVRIATDTADLPATSSDTFVLSVAPQDGPRAPVRLPVEDAVIEHLSRILDVSPDAEVLRRSVDEALDELDAAAARADEARADEDDAYRAVAAELLARWPGLDDPWRSDFEARLSAARPHLTAYFEHSMAYARYARARARNERALAALGEASRRAARLERLERAVATVAAAARLAASDRHAFARFRALRACESQPIRLASGGADAP